MPYTTKILVSMFSVSHQTIKNWGNEFADYLSPTATPESNRARLFTDEDLRIFDLIHTMKQEGKVFEDIHIALAQGHRGNIPDVPRNLAPTQQSVALTIAMQRVVDLETMIEAERNKTEAEREQRIRAEGQRDLLKEQLREAQAELARVRQGK